MISDDRIRAEMQQTLEGTNVPALGQVEVGKVRDSYRLGDRRVLVTTDRISAFDVVLGTIPFKGQVLNQLAAFWFEKSKDAVPNHVIEVPDPNIMVVHECDQLPIEMVVRGYITGVTKTSLWMNYDAGQRVICGNELPDGLKKDQKLDQPICTPTTKHEAHDRNISRQEAIDEGLLDGETFDAAADICFRLYDMGVKHAASQGLILVDTKYELGWLNGQIVISDEVHTPDSSRYWFSDTYEELFAQGEPQRKIDKEYVREWYAAQNYRGDGPPPPMTDDLRVEAAKRYIQAYETVTGQEFLVTDQPVSERVAAALASLA